MGRPITAMLVVNLFANEGRSRHLRELRPLGSGAE